MHIEHMRVAGHDRPDEALRYELPQAPNSALLLSVGKVEPALLVPTTHVTGVQPAAACLPLRGFRILVVREDSGPPGRPNNELAQLAWRHRSVVLVDHVHLD